MQPTDPPPTAAVAAPAGSAPAGSTPAFADALLDWFDRHGRHDLPWQREPTPYRVWVSEIMLQQTQVAVVIPYFARFLARFPDIPALAAAGDDEVLHLWSGLGYYARARNLHRAAEIIVRDHQGRFPATLAAAMALPGIGRSTAGAVLSLAFGQHEAILDGNCKRVLARCFGVPGWPGTPAVQTALWALAERLTPAARVGAYNQAMMDLGATRCTRTRPACGDCPLAGRCVAFNTQRVGAFPAARPRRALPLRATELLLILDPHGDLLLHRRPPSGLWGGLWTPPALADSALPLAPATGALAAPDPTPTLALAQGPVLTEAPTPTADLTAAVTDWCRTHLASAPARIERLPPRRHDFTHFGLHIHPVLVSLAATPGCVADRSDQRWIDPAAPGRLGLPAPIRRLLAELAELAGGALPAGPDDTGV